MSKRGAIVTGAASGIGLALTRDLLSKGWRVIMADINPAGEAIAQDLGHDAIFIKTDTSDWMSQTELFEKGIFSSIVLPSRTMFFQWLVSSTVLMSTASIQLALQHLLPRSQCRHLDQSKCSRHYVHRQFGSTTETPPRSHQCQPPRFDIQRQPFSLSPW